MGKFIFLHVVDKGAEALGYPFVFVIYKLFPYLDIHVANVKKAQFT